MFEIVIRYGDGVYDTLRGFRTREQAKNEAQSLQHEGSEVLWCRIEKVDDDETDDAG